MSFSELKCDSASSSSAWGSSFGPANALTADSQAVFCSSLCRFDANSAAQTPWLKLDLVEKQRPISTIIVLNDLRTSTNQANRWLSLRNVQVTILDPNDRPIWSSSLLSAPDHSELVFKLPICLFGAKVVVSRQVEASDPPNRAYLCTSGVIVYGLATPFRPITFLRHGESQHNVGIPWDPVLGPTLTEKGEQQASLVLTTPVDVDVVYVSPMRRALRTAHVVATALGKPLHVQCRAHELGHAAWQELNPPVRDIIQADGFKVGQVFDEEYLETMRQKHPKVLLESATEIRERARGVIDFLLARSEYSGLLVAHNGMIQELLQVLVPEGGFMQLISHCQPICLAFPIVDTPSSIQTSKVSDGKST